MKARHGILTLVMLLFAAAPILAQGWYATEGTAPWHNSFRNASTAGLLEDDLDLMLGLYGYLDPARIEMIEGKRLYTNLSNLLTKGEEQFNPSSMNTFLIGGNGNVMDFGKVGLLYNRQSDRNPYYVGTDAYGNSVYGELQREDVSLVNLDGVPGYDAKQTLKQRTTGWSDQSWNDYFLALTRQFSNIKAGFVFHRRTDKYFEYGTARNFSRDRSLMNLNTGQTLLVATAKDTGRIGYEASENIIGLSAWNSLTEDIDVSLRLALGFGGMTQYDEEDYVADSAYTLGDSYNHTRSRMLTEELGGTMFSFGAAGIYKWSKIVNTRADIQISTNSYKPEAGANFAFSERRVNNIIDPSTTDSTYSDNISGENSESDLDIRVKNTVKWDAVEFAIGLGLITGKREALEERERAYTIVRTYAEGGNPSLPASYVETSTWNQSWEYLYTSAYRTIVVPVGLEFRVTKPIVFRLGAEHWIDYRDYTNNITLLAGDGRVITRRRYGDGTETNSVTPATLNQPTGSSNTYNSHSSYTHYTYGACWNVSKNLQLDFMGFAELTDLTSWKLSAVVKF